ncbi:hypothetical protein Bbelb_430010 [Branchiostoma belcheri]|nr:hypothetical protein Bbelb_430010 [Branchiostoma belcheri]
MLKFYCDQATLLYHACPRKDLPMTLLLTTPNQGQCRSHDGNPRIVVTTTSDPIVRSFSGGSEEDFPPSKVNHRRRRNHQSLLLRHEPIRRSTFPGQYSQADGSTERRVQTQSIAPRQDSKAEEVQALIQQVDDEALCVIRLPPCQPKLHRGE